MIPFIFKPTLIMVGSICIISSRKAIAGCRSPAIISFCSFSFWLSDMSTTFCFLGECSDAMIVSWWSLFLNAHSLFLRYLPFCCTWSSHLLSSACLNELNHMQLQVGPFIRPGTASPQMVPSICASWNHDYQHQLLTSTSFWPAPAFYQHHLFTSTSSRLIFWFFIRACISSLPQPANELSHKMALKN